MSQEKDIPLSVELYNVSPDLFTEFLTSVGVDFHCPSCGSEDLMLPTSSITTAPDSPKQVDPFTFVSYYTVNGAGSLIDDDELFEPDCYYRVGCQNCGHVRNFAITPVLNWMRAKKASKGSH
ncbi:hypothetical protein [Yersinia aleksiciae]|uniref:hypothetical protein n=1 Tax=Yersinia aleksiciae TaxID=263819 RepID=UPI0011A47840|nr:hypothetical protein [Yersinia aleksiciae]